MQVDDTEALARIGVRIRELREHYGITQVELAKRVYVSQPSISQWEKGHKLPALATQFRLADALQTTRSKLYAELEAGEAAA